MNARVVIENGIPELHLDGRRASRVWSRLNEPGYYAPEKLDQYVGTGIEVFFTCNNNQACSCWDGRDEMEFGHYDAHLRAIVAKKPDIKLILYWGFADGAPYLWRKDNQDELALTDRGIRIGIASFASARWRADSGGALRRFVEHYSTGEFAEHVIGYNPIYLNNEWFCWTDFGAGAADFSAVNIAGFRAWLQVRYAGDEAQLRAAWRRPVTFADAMPPTSAERDGFGEAGTFAYFEKHGANVADYFRFHNESVAALFLDYCRTVKEATGNTKLAGGMFSYTRMGWPACSNRFGHDAARLVLESPDVDFLHGPYDYTNRCFGGVHYGHQSPASIRQYGKLYVDQIDTKTYLHPPPNTNAKTPWETLQVLKRDISHSLAYNTNHYWYEMAITTFSGQNQPGLFRVNTYDAPDINAWITRLKQITDDNQQLRSGSNKEVAIFFSKEADYYRNPNFVLPALTMLSVRNHFLPYTGVPFDEYWLEDFDHLAHDYRVYFFLNAFAVSAQLREQIHQRLKGTGATAIWVYAPGYVADGVVSLANCETLTGIRLQRCETVTDFLQVRLPDGREYGTDLDPAPLQAKQEWAGWIVKEREQQKITPIFYADDPAAEVRGEVRGHGWPGLVVKEVDGYRSLYSAAPILDSGVLVSLLEEAGVHRYSDRQDVVYANDRFVTVCANGDGLRTLRLRRPCDVSDAFTGERLARQVDHHSFQARHGEVFIFRTD